MRTVVFERRLPINIVLPQHQESEVSVTKVNQTDLLNLEIWGELHLRSYSMQTNVYTSRRMARGYLGPRENDQDGHTGLCHRRAGGVSKEHHK